jgi:hypothetical protein
VNHAKPVRPSFKPTDRPKKSHNPEKGVALLYGDLHLVLVLVLDFARFFEDEDHLLLGLIKRHSPERVASLVWSRSSGDRSSPIGG